jgi:hypothetical protein
LLRFMSRAGMEIHVSLSTAFPTRFSRRIHRARLPGRFQPPLCGTDKRHLSSFHSIGRSAEALLNIGFAMNWLAGSLSHVLRLDGQERRAYASISTQA